MKIADILSENEQSHAESWREFLHCIGMCIKGHGFRTLFSNEQERVIKSFDTWMAELGQPMTLYRGFSLESWDQLDESFDFRRRNIVVDPAYMHTSKSKETARGDFISGHDGIEVLLEIATTAQTKGIDVGENIGAYEEEFLSHLDPEEDPEFWEQTIDQGDSEVILDKNLRMRVIAKERETTTKELPPLRGRKTSRKIQAESWNVKLQVLP